MSIIIIKDNFNKELFNSLANHPMQSWEWGEARKETGVKVIRFGIEKNQTFKNVFTLTIHKIPHLNYCIGYIPRSVMPSKEFLEYLEGYAKENNIIFIKFEPYVTTSEKKQPTTYSLQLSPTPLFPEWTQIVDLTQSNEDLMNNMKSKTRYNVRYAIRKGVEVREESNDQGFDEFCKLYFKTTDRQKYYGHDRHYHEIVWNHLKDGIAHILIAYYKNEPLAAYELFHFNDRFYYPYGGSSDKHRNVQASSRIMWEAILLGKKLGAKTFDMWGSLGPDYNKNNDWSGFTRFKEGYGTEFVQFVGSYDLVINPRIYKIYNLIYKTRNFLLEKGIL